MAIRIQVIARDGRPPVAPIQAEFDELGGSIGRGQDSTLLLPDPQRVISRTHAVVLYRNGSFVIRDEGTATPLLVNGMAVGNGNEVPIADGDKLDIGGYTLRIESRAEAGLKRSDFNRSSKAGGESVLEDPFADLAHLTPVAPVAPPVPVPWPDPVVHAAGAAQSEGMIPPGFDPFADPLDSLLPPLPILEDFDPRVGSMSDHEFDDLLPRRDPFGQSDWQHGHFQPIERDDTPELHGSFVPPRFMPDQKAAAVERPYGEVAPEPVGLDGLVQARKSAQTDPAARQSKAGSAVAPPGNSASSDELLHAFLQGLGMPELEPPEGLTSERMHLVGLLLREAVQGTMDLLLARALTKREVRAEGTVIAASQNNPLKFSPNVEAALQHLLLPAQRGFMEPAAALHDAYDDLRSHQFGFTAGMRAALAGVLQRFDPATLEERLKQSRVLDNLIPLHRKAKLWDLFSELYSEISREAEDDFHTLFGREFLRAYQEQIAKLRQKEAGSP